MTIIASGRSAIWLADADGHFIMKDFGRLECSLQPGVYRWRLTLSGKDYYELDSGLEIITKNFTG